MLENPAPKPLKTWSYLTTGKRRRPSEYEVVSTGLHYHTLDQDKPWELDPDIPMARWYKQYRNQSPLRHADWDAFRDPDEMIYRTYNIVQDGQENYVMGLFDQFNERGHDQMLEADWVRILAKSYSPARYLLHALQMGSAYVHQMAPSSTITNCATLRYQRIPAPTTCAGSRIPRTARAIWEEDPRWKGFRELLETALVTWDWAESFTAFFLVAKPAIEEALLVEFGNLARAHGDMLLGLLTQAQMRDAERHRRWVAALARMALETAGNRELLTTWCQHWVPVAESAVTAFCAIFPTERAESAARATSAAANFRASLGLAS